MLCKESLFIDFTIYENLNLFSGFHPEKLSNVFSAVSMVLKFLIIILIKNKENKERKVYFSNSISFKSLF